MTDILCRWLNDDVKLSSNIEKENVSKLFGSGYLFGEILHKYGLQDDFSSFSKGRTTDSKLNNFTRIESVIKLLEIPYDTNVAKSIMNENHGAATKLLYQLFIALGRKAKKNLTGVAMETMRPSAPVKLEGIESAMHKERLKQLVPRQVDVNFETLVERYQNKQKLQEDIAARKKQEEEIKVRKYQQDLRQRGLEKSRLARDKQNEVMQKMRDARVRIPKLPESKKSTKTKQEIRKEMEIQEVKDHISLFEESMRTNLSPQSSVHLASELGGKQDLNSENKLFRKPLQPIALKTAGDDYVSKIKKRLNEDAVARKEREKRRRRVLIEQLKAHEAQEEQRREEMLVKRLMRQSQQEKRIAVQLMQIRHEKQVIKENRIFREEQYAERRLKDFEDALNREAEMCRLAQIEYRDQIRKAENERKELLDERRKEKYDKHYKICQQILSDIVDLSCKTGEYRELTEGDVPEKLLREWKGYFDAALPLYPHEILTEEEIERSKELLLEEEKNKLTDESDFTEYRGGVGEWDPGDDTQDTAQIPPKDNPILGHIIQKLFNIICPPEPPPPTPEFPLFPIKACFLGKFFSGKTTAVERLTASHRVVRLCIDDLIQDATEAYRTGETTEVIENTKSPNIQEDENKQPTEAEETKVSEQIHEETKENQDPNNATVSETGEIRDCGDNQGTGNDFEEKKSFYIVRKATSRAILGEKAYGYLKRGTQIPDQLLVDITVDAVRQVPVGTGWILDGFPSTISQAKILEKSLTGYDASKEVKPKETKGRGKKSRIALDPHPGVETSPPKSGIDIVVLFDVSDDVVLRRAEGRTYNPTNSEVFHQEFNPPSDGSYTGLGKQERVFPVVDPSNDREQVQQRITGFDDSWSKLEKWFNKFGILSKVDVDNSIDDVYERVATLLEDTTEKIHGPSKEETSEQATEASIEVTQATPENDIVEVVNTAVDEPIETHEDVEATKDVLNTRTVSPKSSKKISKKDRSPSPPNKAASPKSSKKNLRPSSKQSSPTPSRKGSKIKSASASRTDTKRAKSPVKKPDVPEELPVEPVLPPGPEPGSKEWEYVDQPIDIPLVTILADRWENLEKTYIDTSKKVFREIRQERELIYRYFYGTRKEFLSFLRRPDEKEEYVLQWQNHYNDVSEDMRGDDEVKAELHKEVDDLCDRLYEICDNRKEMAENERTVVMEEGWLQDRLGLLTNHYLTLMQVEVDRYQDTYRVLKDYYSSAEGKNPVEAYSEICRIPLIHLPPIIPAVSSSGSEHGSQHEVKQTSSRKDREHVKTPEGPTSEGEDHRIPLVPRRPKSGDLAFSKEKKDKRSSKDKRDKADNQSETPVLPTDPDERLVFDGFYNALAIIEILTSLDQAEQEEEANKLAEALKEREKEKEKDVGKKGGKDKKQEKKGKKSANKAKQQETPPPVPPCTEGENEEEKWKKERKEKARKEFLAAVQFEDISLRTRLEMIRNRSVTVLQELKMKADITYKDMDDWLGARFLQEVDSIRAMADLARTAIENEQKLQQQLILEDKDFVVNWDLNVFRTPSPTPPPSPKEQTSNDSFTVIQLEHLYNQFVKAAPSGLISCRAFVDIFLDLMSTSFGMEMLPDIWIRQTGVQLHSLTTSISQDSEFVDWKKFLVLASTALPVPSRNELFNTLSRFMNIDVEKTGLVSEQQFLQLNLWFAENSEQVDGPVYPRMKYLKQLLFKIFSNAKETPPVLNYEDFLLYFAMDENPIEGILRALTIVCYQAMPSSSLFQNESIMKDTGTAYSTFKDISCEVGGNALVTLQDFVKVFNHGGSELSDRQRFQGAEHTPFSKDRLCGVFMELGASETESLPFYILYQHPIIEDCIHICQRFKYHNLQNLLKCERYPGSINEGR